MISTLSKVSSQYSYHLRKKRRLIHAKFPWFAVDMYTVNSRDDIFEKTIGLVKLLTNQLRRSPDVWIPHLHESLLIDLLYAGLNVPAFGEYQRMRLREAAGEVGDRVSMSPLLVYWPFEVLCRKSGIEEDYLAVSRMSPCVHTFL